MTINFSYKVKTISKKNIETKLLHTLKTLRSKTKDKNHLLFHIQPDKETIDELKDTTKKLSASSETLIVAGVGGSSLAAKVFCALSKEKKVFFWEGVEPRKIKEASKKIDFGKCSLNIVSKSGNTTETIVNSAFLVKKIKDACGKSWKEKVVLTASQGEGTLIKWAKEEKIKIAEIPSPVGGRFSAFTAVGLLPALFSGLDAEKIKKGVETGLKNGLPLDINSNVSAALAKFYLETMEQKIGNIVIWGYGEICHLLSLWIQQLWAESLGKKKITPKGEIKTGLFPTVLKGSEDQHSILQYLREGKTKTSVIFLTENYKGEKIGVFERNFAGLKRENLHYGDIQKALKEGTKSSLQKIGIPVSEFSIDKASEESIAETMTIFIISALIIADFLKINPFGQDGVEEGKKITKSLLF